MEYAINMKLEVRESESSTTQNWFRLSASGVTLWEGYEQSLMPVQIALVKEVVGLHGKAISKFADKIRG